tara:strand:- start:17 stop:295 length:279 start_codon:yes stop_codon:yes gene_type:complete
VTCITNNLTGGFAPATGRDEMSIEYKVYDNNMLLLKKYKKPLQWIGEGNDWRVEQIINGEVEKIWDGGWSKAYAEKTKKYLERSAGLEFFDL